MIPSSPYASDAKITEAVTAIGATLVGQTEQTLLQQILVAIASGYGNLRPNASVLRSVSATTSYVSLGSQTASSVSILNKTGATLDIQMASDTGSGKLISLADGLSVRIQVEADASEIQIKSASGTTGVYLVIDS